MALALPFYASISMSQSAQGILTGRRSHLRFLKCRKDARKILLPTACCLDPVQITPTVVANLKAIKILSESMERLVSSHKQSLIMADLDPQTAKFLIAITEEVSGCTFPANMASLFIAVMVAIRLKERPSLVGLEVHLEVRSKN